MSDDKLLAWRSSEREALNSGKLCNGCELYVHVQLARVCLDYCREVKL